MAPAKIIQFKKKIKLFCETNRSIEKRAFFKTINQKIQGFGNYYKHGNVGGLFAGLDAFIRAQVRQSFRNKKWEYPSNAYIKKMGLRSLVELYKKIPAHIIGKRKYGSYISTKTNQARSMHTEDWSPYLEKLIHQNTEIIGLLRTQNNLLSL